MAAPAEIRELVTTFARNRESYHSDAFNELQLRHHFLNPFFASLGWDVENRQGYAEAHKDRVYQTKQDQWRPTTAERKQVRQQPDRPRFLPGPAAGPV